MSNRAGSSLCKTILAIAVVSSSLLAAPASAEVKRNAVAKVSMDIPSGWTTKENGDLTVVTDPTTDVAFLFLVTDGADMKASIADLDKKLASTLTDVKWAGQPTKITLNGMDGIKNNGMGKVNGKKADLGLIIVKTPADKRLVFVAVVDDSKKAQHVAEVKAMANSIKPAP